MGAPGNLPHDQCAARPARDPNAALFVLADFAAQLRERLTDLNLSYRQAAKEIRVPTPTLHRIATATKAPNVENYLRIDAWLYRTDAVAAAVRAIQQPAQAGGR